MLEGEERIKILTIINNAIATRPLLPDYLNLLKNGANIEDIGKAQDEAIQALVGSQTAVVEVWKP